MLDLAVGSRVREDAGAQVDRLQSASLSRSAKPRPLRQKSPHAPSEEEMQAVEIIFKPTPVYTDEARRLGIQGDVGLSVIFKADGTIRVLGVVKSLGHGLDQEALRIAPQIRFKPAKQGGHPADFPATLRIEFRLAGQSAG